MAGLARSPLRGGYHHRGPAPGGRRGVGPRLRHVLQQAATP